MDRIAKISNHVVLQNEETIPASLIQEHRNGSGVLWKGSSKCIEKALELFLTEGIRNFPIVNMKEEIDHAIHDLHGLLRDCENDGLRPKASRSAPRQFFLTGGTGFIGIHVLGNLLMKFPESKVHCLIRGRDSQHCKERLHKATELHDVALDFQRLVMVPGDIRKKQLGMADKTWAELVIEDFTVLHFAAKDNFFMPFAVLKPFHVTAVLNVIEFCARGCMKSLLYVSSCKHRLIDELQGKNCRDNGLFDGYAQSKTVGHKLAEEMWRLKRHKKHVPPIKLCNLGYVYPDKHPIPKPDISDAWEVVMKVCLLRNVVPDINCPMDYAPISYVSDCFVEIVDTHSAADQQPAREGDAAPWFEIYAPRGLWFADVRLALERYRKGRKELSVVPIESFSQHWYETLQEAGTTASKCLSKCLTDQFVQQCSTVFGVGPACYRSASVAAPPPVGEEYLSQLISIIDKDMTLSS